MKIALVYTGSFRGAGVERIVWESARHLSERHAVTVVADYWEDCRRGGVTYVRASPWRRPRELQPLTFRLRARPCVEADFDRVISHGVVAPGNDILWVHSLHRVWMRRKLEAATWRGRVKGYLSWLRPQNIVLLALERYQFREGRYRHIVAVGTGVVDDLETVYGIPRAAVTVVPNGFSPEEFSPSRREALRDAVRAELGYRPDDVVILVVAHELDRKGVPTLVAAVDRVADPRLRVLLVGRAAPTPGLARPWLRYHGPVDDVGRLHAAADLFVLPTRYETGTLALREALASGIPVITSDVPGARDPIRPGVNGLLQRDPLDAEELADLLRDALDPDRRAAWAQAAPGSVAELAWPAVFDRFEEEVLDSRPVASVT